METYGDLRPSDMSQTRAMRRSSDPQAYEPANTFTGASCIHKYIIHHAYEPANTFTGASCTSSPYVSM